MRVLIPSETDAIAAAWSSYEVTASSLEMALGILAIGVCNLEAMRNYSPDNVLLLLGVAAIVDAGVRMHGTLKV